MGSSCSKERSPTTRARRALVTLEQSLHEEDASREKGVIRLECSDAQKHHQQHRRDQNGIHHGQALPEHVHEDGNDQPRLQQHEQDDQKPPRITFVAVIRRKITPIDTCVPWKPVIMKNAAPNWAAPKGLPQGRIPSWTISLVHSKACMPTNVAPSAAVHSRRIKVIFLFFS